jgi:hypothetical protein
VEDMACVYSDHCMRLLSRKFFSEDACVVIGHILALHDDRLGVRTISEDYLTRRCGFNEHRVRRVLGAYERHGLITKSDPPRECRVALKLTFPESVIRKARYRTFTKTNAALTIQQGQLIASRDGKLKQMWSMDTRENMRILEQKFRKMDTKNRNHSRSTLRCDCGQVSEETMTASESGEMVCFLCGSMVNKDDHEEGYIRLWELDVYEAMEYALRYRYPSLKYTEALKSTFPVPPRFQRPVQESIDSDEDEWEDVPHEEKEEEDSDEDIFVNVMGVPKAICDITEDDQQNMTDEEYSAFYSIVC